MSENRPLYLVGPPGSLRERVLSELAPPTRVVERPAAIEDGDAPGVVLLLEGELPAEEVLALVETLGRSDGAWVCCLLREVGDELEVRTVSVGWRESLEAVEAFRQGDDDRLLELRRSMKRISRARHDINNPLTSAMAETQLLLMDVQEPEATESLEVVQEQLRRIRDLVAATRGLRVSTD